MQLNIHEKLQAVIRLQQSGMYEGAEQICREVLAVSPNQCDALHFLGLIRKRARDFDNAESFLRRSLSINPRQPQVWNSLANLKGDLRQFEEAEACYGKATKLDPRYAEAWFNWGVTLNDQQKYDNAIRVLKKAVSCNPGQPKYHNALGIAYKESEQLDEAERCFEAALRIDPDYIKAVHNLGGVYRERKRLDDAKKCFLHVLKRNAAQQETLQNLAAVYHEEGDAENAIIAYKRILELDPAHLESHTILNNLLWENEQDDEFLKSYESAIRKRPDCVELPVAYAEALERAGRAEQAFAVLKDAEKRFYDNPSIHHSFANLYKLIGTLDEACKSFEACLSPENRDNEQYHIDYAETLIMKGEVRHALLELEKAELINPYEQRMLGFKAVCWRILGDEREHWLCNYERFVRAFEIEVPKGFSSIEDLNSAYAEVLNELHRLKRHPLDQTLRGGTQTFAGLYKNKHEVIRKVAAAVRNAARQYISELPDDDTHPTIRRLKSDVNFAGSWSCRLTSEGFHTTHVHPAGWISGPYYVHLPDEVKNSTEQDKQGWVIFGKSSLNMDEHDTPRKLVKPREGIQVFFPSFIWHGTIPFKSNDYRMTSPCDLVPV